LCRSVPGGARHPPSFPTRRSSDLRFGHPSANLGAALGKRLDVLGIQLAQAGGDALGEPVPLEKITEGESGGRKAARHAYARSSEDRKSTRLNSSHVKISYAVFCWT